MEEKTCFFIGHRKIRNKDYEKIFYLSKIMIEILIKEKEVTYFKVGGGKGFDSIVLFSIIEIKKFYPNIKLILVLPYKNQIFNWFQKYRKLYKLVLENIDGVIYISKYYIKDCINKKNDKLIEDSRHCISYLRKNTKIESKFYNIIKARNIKVYNINDYLV